MVKLRLKRTGKSVQPSFRIVVMPSQTKLNGKYIARLGTYDPIKKHIDINEELTLKFLLEGAEPTATVRNLLQKKGIMEKLHNIKINQKKLQKEGKNQQILSSSKTLKQSTPIDQK